MLVLEMASWSSGGTRLDPPANGSAPPPGAWDVLDDLDGFAENFSGCPSVTYLTVTVIFLVMESGHGSFELADLGDGILDGVDELLVGGDSLFDGRHVRGD